jgi:hypothetical protein
VIGQLGSDPLIGDASDPERRPVTQRPTEGGDHVGGSSGEQLLGRRPERSREAQCCINRGCVAARLDRCDQLPAHTGPLGEFRLRQAAFVSTLA